MCTKHLVCDRNTWYVPERPDMFSEIMSCVRKRCHMCTQLMTDNLLQIITRFLYYLPMLFYFIYLLCHIYPGVPHQCAALFSLGLLHYMHDKTNTNELNQHTFSYNTVTTLTTGSTYVVHTSLLDITCIMLTTYTCSSLQWLHAFYG